MKASLFITYMVMFMSGTVLAPYPSPPEGGAASALSLKTPTSAIEVPRDQSNVSK